LCRLAPRGPGTRERRRRSTIFFSGGRDVEEDRIVVQAGAVLDKFFDGDDELEV
jgi:hypothetical protein